MKRKFEAEEEQKKKLKIETESIPQTPQILYLESKFDPTEYLLQLDDDCYFIPEGYKKYQQEIKDNFPNLLQYFDKNEKPAKEQYIDCKVANLEYKLIEAGIFYSKIKLQRKDKPDECLNISFFVMLDGLPFFLILKELFDETKKIMNNLKVKDVIRVTFDKEPYKGIVQKINTEKIWENITASWEDGSESDVSCWDILTENKVKLNKKIDPAFEKKISNVLKKFHYIGVPAINGKKFPYPIFFMTIISRCDLNYYRSLNSLKFDLNHIFNCLSDTIKINEEFKKFAAKIKKMIKDEENKSLKVKNESVVFPKTPQEKLIEIFEGDDIESEDDEKDEDFNNMSLDSIKIKKENVSKVVKKTTKTPQPKTKIKKRTPKSVKQPKTTSSATVQKVVVLPPKEEIVKEPIREFKITVKEPVKPPTTTNEQEIQLNQSKQSSNEEKLKKEKEEQERIKRLRGEKLKQDRIRELKLHEEMMAKKKKSPEELAKEEEEKKKQQEMLIKKKQEELQKKQQEAIKNQEEIKLKKEEEFKKNQELKRIEEMKRIEELKKQKEEEELKRKQMKEQEEKEHLLRIELEKERLKKEEEEKFNREIKFSIEGNYQDVMEIEQEEENLFKNIFLKEELEEIKKNKIIENKDNGYNQISLKMKIDKTNKIKLILDENENFNSGLIEWENKLKNWKIENSTSTLQTNNFIKKKEIKLNLPKIEKLFKFKIYLNRIDNLKQEDKFKYRKNNLYYNLKKFDLHSKYFKYPLNFISFEFAKKNDLKNVNLNFKIDLTKKKFDFIKNLKMKIEEYDFIKSRGSALLFRHPEPEMILNI
eukprot:gene2808-4216_t